MPPERRFVQVVCKGKEVAMFWYDKSGNYIGHDYCKGQFYLNFRERIY
jgi:hypothetical protein